ncbi:MULTISPECIES: hypothetical protein [Eikenella]|nr:MULTISPECIES: hypothetical protein [Eikenella]
MSPWISASEGYLKPRLWFSGSLIGYNATVSSIGIDDGNPFQIL